MGKTQSKRSVDITTDPKKGPEEEVTGKMEKIEDVDQKEINGDATIQEKSDAEKKDAEETENDKDLTTEKSSGDAAKGGGDSADPKSPESADAESPKEDPNATKDSVATEEISPLADESIKKSKKDKVKKKWSFRSISFGKKDKQKPAKTEETAETSPTAAAATNGEGDKAPEGAESTEEASKKEDGAGAAAGNDGAPTAGETKPTENGDEAKTELNGDNTETEAKTSENNDAANDINKTTETTPVVSNDNTANETQTENKAAAEPPTANTTTTAAVTSSAEIVTNGNANDDSAKNGVADNEEAEPVKAPEGTNVESNKTIPCVEEKPHQNGTNGDANEAEEEPEHITNKSQIEVKTISTNNTCTSTTSTSTSLNNIVNEQAETLVMTQNTTTTTSNTSKSFQSNETSNDIILESSSSNLDSDKNDPPQVQNILPNVQTTISNEQKENIDNFNAVAISDDNNSLKYEKISQQVNDLVNVNVVFIEQQPKTEEILSDKKDSLSSSPIVDIIDDEIEACSSEVVDQQIEVQAPPPPLPASPPPSRVSVFAFKDNDVDFVEVNEDTTSDNIKEDIQKSIEIVNDEKQQSEIIQNPIVPILMIPLPNLDSDIGKNFIEIDNIETRISNEPIDLELKNENNDLIHEVKDDYVFVSNQNEQSSSTPIETTEIITEQVSVNNDNPLTLEQSVVSHEDTQDDKSLAVASTDDKPNESVESLDREQIAAVETIINEITEKAVEIICDKQEQIQDVNEQPENKIFVETSSPVASPSIINEISPKFEQCLNTNEHKDEGSNDANDEENIKEASTFESKESLELIHEENEDKTKKSSNIDINIISMQDSLNANENSIDQDNNDANIESQIENIIQSKIEIEIIKEHDVDVLSIKNEKQLTSTEEDSLNANESKNSSGNSGAVEDILTSTLNIIQNDDDTKTVISISNIDLSPKTRLNGNNESLIDDELVKDINQEQNIIQNVDDNVKEINAKDLKENAAAETTQDLPVKCE